MRIAILGGGLAGISLAYLLSDKSVTIYEKKDSIGGLCSSKVLKGYTYDIGGSHIIFSKDKDMLEFLLNQLGNNSIINQRNTKILMGSKLIQYPFENGIYELKFYVRFKILLSYLKARLKIILFSARKVKSFKESIILNFGKQISKLYLIPYNEKIWNYPLENIDNFWIKDRLPIPRVLDMLKATLGIKTEGYVHQLFFHYPKTGGIKAIIDSMKLKTNAEILTNQELIKIEKRNDKWIIMTEKESRKFDILISTIAIQDLVSLIKETPEEVINTTYNLLTNSMICIFLGIKGKINSKFADLSWFYIPEQKNGFFHRISIPSNFSTLNAPKGNSSLLVEITTSRDSEIWKKDNESLIKEVVVKLEELEIIDKNQIEYQDLIRWDRAYVIYDKDYLKNIKIVRNFFRDKGIYSCGRFAQFEYLNMDNVVKNAHEIVKNIDADG